MSMKTRSNFHAVASTPPGFDRPDVNDGARGRFFRQFLLLISLLVEAGLPIFPRVPMSVLLFVLSATATLRRGGVDRNIFWLFLIPVVVAGEMVFFHPGTTMEMLASRFVNFCSAILIVNLYTGKSAKHFVRDLQPIFYVMSLQAIATFLLGTFVDDWFSSVDLDGLIYKTIGYVFTYHMIVTDFFVKADGFFFERGVFQLFLNLYLYISLFILKSKTNALLAILGILSTWSTAGVVLSFGIVFFAFLASLRRRGKSTIGAKLFVLTLLPALIYVAIENVSDKLYGSGSSSADARVYDLYSGLTIATEYPLFGLGFSGETYADVLRKQSILFLPNLQAAERSQSNGIMRLFITIGIPMGVLLIFGMFGSPLFANPAIVGGILFVSLLSEAIIYCPFILVIVFSGLVKRTR